MRSPFDVVIITLGEILSLMIIVDSLLSFVLPPDHPLREILGRVLQPLYAPIRRIVPPLGMMDFTPLIVLLLIQLVVGILTSIF